MVINSAVAVGAGRLLELLPHRVLGAIVAALFAAGALYLFLTGEPSEHAGERKAAKPRTSSHVVLASLAVILVAELGDLTQVLTANLAAHYHQPWSVFLGACLALVTVVGIGVVSGRALLRVLPLGVIRKAAGLILAGFAVYSAVAAAT